MTTKELEELRLSVSKTKVFAQCKKQFEFNYILKFPKKDEEYHILGKFCHKVLEDFHRAYINGSSEEYNVEMGKAFKTAMIEFKAGMTAAMKKECWDMINKYLHIIIENKDNEDKNNYNRISNVIEVEKNFKLNIGDNVILNGMIDKIQIDNDNITHIADYKTTKNKKYLVGDFFQLLTYAFVMVSEDQSIKKIRASYILLRHDYEYITTEFSLDQIMEIKDKYMDYADKIRNETEYPATTSALCNYCSFQEHCVEGRAKSYGNNPKIFGAVDY